MEDRYLTPDGRLMETLERFIRLYDANRQQMLSKYNLYIGQPRILLCLRDMPEPPTQNQLAKELGVGSASVGTSLRRLEQAGFIKRTRDKADSRCVKIALTSKGREYARWSQMDMDRLAQRMANGFSTEDMNDLSAGLARINKNLE